MERFLHFKNGHVYLKMFETAFGDIEVFDEKLEVFHTEKEESLFIYRVGDKWYSNLEGEFVIYQREDRWKALQGILLDIYKNADFGFVYMRPKEMFFDKVIDPKTNKLVDRFQKINPV